MKIEYLYKSFLALCLVTLLCSQLNAPVFAMNTIVTCDPGYFTGSSPIQGIPTYDYGTDGLVRFHFVLDGNGWAPTNNVVAVHGANCEYLYAKSYTFASSGNIPAGITHLMVKAQETSPGSGWYVFSAYDGDKNEPVGLGGMPTQVNEPFVGFAILQNPSYGVNYGAKSPVVPVKDPNRTAYKTPVLIVPGVMGTDLMKGDELLWANPKMANPLNSDDFMDPLGFQNNLTPIDNSIVTGSVITRKPFFDYTDGLTQEFEKQGYTSGKDLFTFPYDWRFGVNSETTAQLKGQVDYILNQTDAGKAAGKVDVIAHSTGGLLLKKYIESYPIDHHVEKAVMVGVPNLGSPKAYKVLMMGDNFDVVGLSDDEMKKIAQNMPVVYQLSPSENYFALGGSALQIFKYDYSREGEGDGFDLSTAAAQTYLVNNFNANNDGFALANQLHTTDFDNLNMDDYGVKTYKIVGCKTWTLGKILEVIPQTKDSSLYYSNGVTGDGTVPMVSANSVPAINERSYYAVKKDHSKLLSADDIKQQIINILAGSNLPVGNGVISQTEMANNPDKCKLTGELLKALSPVYYDVTDEHGNRSTIAEDGSIQNDIPGASYQVLGDHKFLFLPTDEGQKYQIKLYGTGTGSYSLHDQTITNDVVTKTQIFADLPSTPDLNGTVNLAEEGASLTVKNTPESDPVAIQPTTVIGPSQSQDLLPPVSTSTLSGTMGQPGFYRGDVVVALNATDTIVSGLEVQTSGVLGIKYSLDANSSDLSYSSYQSYVGPITVSTEGSHTLSFYSVDRAGNREEVKTITFTIDNSAPEVSLQFDQKVKDLVFSGIDNLPVTVSDKDDLITITDQAGNTTVLKLKDKNRKRSLKAEIKSISYNGQAADLSKNGMVFSWGFDRKDKDKLVLLSQIVAAKKDYLISAIYNGKTTMLIGRDASGKIKKTLPGLTLLKLTTSRGDLNWSY